MYNPQSMKQGIHPTYYVDAKVKCSTCGTVYEFGSTVDGYDIAICAHCHPFYTGEQQVVLDTANKISTFKEKMDKAAELKKRLAEIESKRAEREKARIGVISSNNEKRVTLKDLLQAKKESKGK